MFENNIVVYKFVQDLHFFVTGGDDENELILATVLQAFFDSVGLLLRLFSYTLLLIYMYVFKGIIIYYHQFITVHIRVLDDFTLFPPFLQRQCGQERST